MAKPCGFFLGRAIWVISWCVSQQQHEHPSGLSPGPRGLSQADTEVGVDGGWTVGYHWQLSPGEYWTHWSLGSCWSELDAEVVGGRMTSGVSRSHQRPRVEPAAVNHSSLGGMYWSTVTGRLANGSVTTTPSSYQLSITVSTATRDETVVHLWYYAQTSTQGCHALCAWRHMQCASTHCMWLGSSLTQLSTAFNPSFHPLIAFRNIV